MCRWVSGQLSLCHHSAWTRLSQQQQPCAVVQSRARVADLSILHPPRPAAKACKVDAEKNCNNTWFFGHSEGRVIACLK